MVKLTLDMESLRFHVMEYLDLKYKKKIDRVVDEEFHRLESENLAPMIRTWYRDLVFDRVKHYFNFGPGVGTLLSDVTDLIDKVLVLDEKQQEKEDE